MSKIGERQNIEITSKDGLGQLHGGTPDKDPNKKKRNQGGSTWRKPKVRIAELLLVIAIVAPFVIFSLSNSYVDGQKSEGDLILKLKSGSFTPTQEFNIGKIINSGAFESKYFFFLQTTRFLNSTEIKNLEDNGITLLDSLNGFVYIANANEDDLNNFQFQKDKIFRSVFPIDPDRKLDYNIKIRDIPSWAKPSNDEFDVDTDKDRIINHLDECPQLPEDYDGDRDTDGCPDEISLITTQFKLPSKLKKIASLWADDQIIENEFLQRVQIEINHGTMVIPEMKIANSGSGSTKIPSWIKNAAGWWADGLVKDADFVSGIQYLFKEGILPVEITLESKPELVQTDTDGDDILDNLDLCPTQPETFNGFKDTDGCPDVVPSTDDKAIFLIYFHEKFPADKMLGIVNVDRSTVIEGISAVNAIMTFEQVKELSKHPTIKFITYTDPPFKPEISEAKKISKITPIQDIGGLTGRGVVALIFDMDTVIQKDTSGYITYDNNGNINTHEDLKGRLFPLDPFNTDDGEISHSFHVAGILGGDGLLSEQEFKGVAPKVQILSWGNDDILDLFSSTKDLEKSFLAANQFLTNGDHEPIDRIDLMNISVGHTFNISNNCKYLGNYTSTSQMLDNFVNGYTTNKTYEKIIITKSVGNERGPLSANCNNNGFGTVNPPATAKNPIVVGSIDTRGEGISYFSSFGPTNDGRIKPDLVAPGTHDGNDGIMSLDVLNGYAQKSGTSMAAPLVGGLVALMEEKWNNRFDSHIEPHTAKAILIHTAEDLEPKGPDYKSGWGLVNGENAINLIANSKVIEGSTNTIELSEFPTIIHDSLSFGSKKEYLLKSEFLNNLKVTLVWDDVAGDLFENDSLPSLQNDLDLSITDNDGNVITYPFLLNSTRPDAEATNGIDKLNNVEMISVEPEMNDELLNEYKIKKIVVNESKWYPLRSLQNFTLIVSESVPSAGCLHDCLTINEDKSMEGSNKIKVIGTTDRMSRIIMKVITPDGSGEEVDKFRPDLDSSGSFHTEITIRGPLWKQDGNYTIIAQQDDDPRYKGSFKVGIKNGVVIPEFGTITIMILTVTIISIIVVSAKSRLSIMSRY